MKQDNEGPAEPDPKTPTEETGWRGHTISAAAILFLASIPTLIIGSMVFGEPGVAWPTVLMAYPALIVIGAVLGFGDLYEVFSSWRAGQLSSDGPVFIGFSIARGGVMTYMFYVFLKLEVRLVTDLLS